MTGTLRPLPGRVFANTSRDSNSHTSPTSPCPHWLSSLKHLPDHTIVYHTSIMQDADGTRFIDASQSVPIDCRAPRVRRYLSWTMWTSETGTVGGYLVSFAAIGQQCCPNGCQGSER